MSAPADEGLRVLRAVVAALGTDEGRALARQIREALDGAEAVATDEGAAPDLVAAARQAIVASRRATARRRGARTT